ncbi:MAG: type II toxin-antitoxin system prevent-host-death family antitoxin [Desulfobacterota bacterium]|jgi:prevent-host-death family protein|nr:type II toxin-antitoxin system prevent-host-death family antitoxin [Thermodesulfobacteriota bacterium]
MKTVTATEFRNHAAGLLTEVEKGEVLLVIRHGRPIAEVSPASPDSHQSPSWKKPGLRLAIKGAGLSAAIIEGRDRENIF